MRWALLFVLLSFGSAVSAQTVTLRAGEHEGFTRVTLSLSAQIGWRVDNLRITFDKPVMIDTSALFQRIGRDRIQGVQRGDTWVQLDLACACEAAAFQEGNQLIVVDIRPKSGPILRPDVLPDLLTREAEPRAVLTLPEGVAPPVITEGSPTKPAPEQLSGLAQALQRAESLGLIEKVEAPAGQTQPAAYAGSDLAEHISAQSNSDEVPDQVALERSRNCPSADFLTNWPAPDVSDFGEKFETTTLPTGRMDFAGIRSLAVTFLSLGFGAEASGVASLLPVKDKDKHLITAMAGMVDEPEFQSGYFTPDFAGCPAPLALWSFLAYPSARQAEKLDLANLVQAYLELPSPLQTALSDRFKSALLSRDRLDLIEIVRRAGGAATKAEPALFDVALADRNGDSLTASKLLQEIVEHDGPAAPIALTKKLLLSLAQDQVAQDDIEQAWALLPEIAGTPPASDLEAAAIQGMIATGQLPSVLQHTSIAGSGVSGNQALTWAISRLSDEELAWIAVRFQHEAPFPISEKTAAALTLVAEQMGFGSTMNDDSWIPNAAAPSVTGQPPQAAGITDLKVVTVAAAELLADQTETAIKALGDRISEIEVSK